MRTLSTAFGPLVEQAGGPPRIYADANIPSGAVAYMRGRLRWDVLFVVEHDDLRRAADVEHYRLSRELRRTLLTQDRDYFDDRRFPPEQSGGVIVFSVPDERALTRLLARLDREMFRPPASGAVPLAGRKLHAHPGWTGADGGAGAASSSG